METRRLIGQTTPPRERFQSESEKLRKQAKAMPPGVRRDELLRKAQHAEAAFDVGEWANSSGLRPPT